MRFVKLGVAATNASALKSYLRLGFRVYGVEPQVIFYDGVYYDELLMVKEIPIKNALAGLSPARAR